MAESDVIGYARGGATAKAKFTLICDSAEHNSLTKPLQNVSDVAGPSLMVLSSHVLVIRWRFNLQTFLSFQIQ